MVIVLVTFPFRTWSRKTNLRGGLGRERGGRWGGGQEGAGPLPAPIQAGRAGRPPVPQFPRLGDAGGCGAESPARVVLLVERNSSADAKIKNRSPGKRVMRLLSWVIAGDYESRAARRGLK